MSIIEKLVKIVNEGARIDHAEDVIFFEGSKGAIRVKKDALNLVPNDTGWFITSSLAFSLYKDNQISEIYNLIGQDIESEDMSARVLALYALSLIHISEPTRPY